MYDFRPLPGSILFMSIAARFYRGIIDDFKKICFKIFWGDSLKIYPFLKLKMIQKRHFVLKFEFLD